MLTAEDAPDAVAEEDPEERTAVIAEMAAEVGSRRTLVPRRIRRIDDRLRDAGLSFSPDGVARLDKGSSSRERMTTRDFAATAVTMIRLGRAAIGNQDLGDAARAHVPRDAASPLASMIEYLSEDPLGVSVQDIDGVVPEGDFRGRLRELMASTPLETLRLAWTTVEELRRWAENLCAAVEGELDARQPGEATLAWLLAASFVGRLFLVIGMRHSSRTPVEQAQTAAGLLLVRDMLQRLRHQRPEGSGEPLDNPAVVPACLQPLLNSGRR
ncbi:MAG: hypothetical protein ACRDQZ_23935 [Mycobacteriales bacterium]